MNDITVGSDTFTGMDSPVKDMSDGATAFRFTNNVNEEKLGNLSVSKKLNGYPQEKVVKKFDVQVTLDGKLLPVGTEYTVGTETRKVETAGIISIAADETATISNILAGTAFEVQETSGSAEGYTVAYSDSGGYTITVKDGKVAGIIKADANVQLVVTNSEKGTTVVIPGTKSVVNPDDTARTYTFRLTEVTDSTGATPVEGGITDDTVTAEVGATAQPFRFEIHYAEVDVEDLSKPFYYKITEAPQDQSLTNSTVYVAEVTITRDETTAALSAAVTALWKDGVKVTDETLSVDFENVLKGSLSLEKTVEGSSAGEGFPFEIKLESGDSGVEIPGETSYPITIYEYSTDTTSTNSIIFRNGVTTISDFKHGDKITIHDLPYGTKWQIMELNADGYKVTTTVTVGDASVPPSATQPPGSATETTGSVTAGDTLVHYTNTYLYELPETGGPGTLLYTSGGALLTTLGVLLLMFQTCAKRRKEENTSF